MPIGYRETGEALGMTLVGTYGDDHKLIRIAHTYEQRNQPRKEPHLSDR